jgi:thiamine biosynthesis protein ThiI
MRERLYLLKLGELVLKGENQDRFLKQLRWDLKRRLEGFKHRIETSDGRFFIELEGDRVRAERILSRVPGITGFAPCIRTEKSIDAILGAAAELASEGPVREGKRRFKAESRRADKSFPLDSYGISSAVGASFLDRFPDLSVDVKNPEFTVRIEIRDKAFVYVDERRGLRGLPAGSSGKGLLLLSGGIDSPVAGYLMALRGLALEAIHFHSYPFTSREAQQKVEDLAKILSRYSGPIELHVVPFTDVQTRIKERAKPNETTLFLRGAMMAAADALAKERNLKSIVTGESLGQVASQTQQSMRFSQSFTDLPVFRPLIGQDKQYTVEIAREIGTFPVSILPYEDCCVLFSPKHPILRPELGPEREAWRSAELEGLIAEALAMTEHKFVSDDWGAI